MSKFLEIPEMWEELTPDQFSYLLRLVFDAKPDDVTIQDLLLKFADYLLGEKQIIAPDRRTQYYKLVNDVAATLNWIFTKDEDNNFILNFETTYNLLPEIAGFTGPQSHGGDLAFGEYRTAIDMMNRYSSEKEVFFLNALCGILYRLPVPEDPQDPESAITREKFSKNRIERYARNFVKVHEYLKWGVYLWFAYFNRYLIEGGEFIIDGNTLSFESIFEREESDTNNTENGIGLMSIVFTLADSGTFGNVSQTEEAMLFPILMKLLHDKQIYDKLKKDDRN